MAKQHNQTLCKCGFSIVPNMGCGYDLVILLVRRSRQEELGETSDWMRAAAGGHFGCPWESNLAVSWHSWTLVAAVSGIKGRSCMDLLI